MLMSSCPKNSHRLKIDVEKSVRNIKENINWTEVSSKVLSLDSNEGMKHLQDAINSHLIFSTRYPFWIWMATKEVLTARKLKDVFMRKIRRSKHVHIKMECVNSIYYQNKLLARLKNMNDQKNIKDIKCMQDGNVEKYCTNRELFKIKTAIKSLKSKEIKSEPILVRKYNGNLASDGKEVGNIFNEFYINFATNLTENITKTGLSIEELLRNTKTPLSSFSLKPISAEDLTQTLSDLKKKRRKIDLIKGINHEIANPLAVIINKSFKEGTFPTCLKSSMIVPKFKYGDRMDPYNYRPISIQPMFSYIIERIVKSQMMPFLNGNQLISDNQFDRGSAVDGRIHAMMATRDMIERERNKGKFVLYIAVDLLKFADTMDITSVLPQKLLHYKFNQNVINWIVSFLTNRKQYVRVNNVISEMKMRSNVGMVQGASFQTEFGNIFLRDLIDNSRFNTTLYTDDTNLLMSHHNISVLEEEANIELAKIQSYFNANRIFLQHEKACYLLFKPRLHSNSISLLEAPPLNLYLGNYQINQALMKQYLGFHIDPTLNFSHQLLKLLEKMRYELNNLKSIKDKVDTETKLQLFKLKTLRTYETYLAWWNINLHPGHIQEIIRMQTEGLRYVYSNCKQCSATSLFKKSGVIRFDLYLKSCVLDLFFKHKLGLIYNRISTGLLRNLNYSRKPKKNSSQNFQIPPEYHQGDLFHQIITTWNNLPGYIKEMPIQRSNFKKRIHDYIQQQLPNCNPCEIALV